MTEIYNIILEIENRDSGVVFIWVAYHFNIKGNEIADVASRAAQIVHNNHVKIIDYVLSQYWVKNIKSLLEAQLPTWRSCPSKSLQVKDTRLN